MSKSVLERIRKLKETRPQNRGGNSIKGIFHKWGDNENQIRLVGNLLEVKTHYIAPAANRGDRGLCIAESFKGDGSISQVINCSNWDIEREESSKKKTCVICQLNSIARSALSESPDKDEKEFLDKLVSDTNARTSLKWNIIDRANPFVTQISDDEEKKVLGMKIATIGMEAWKDIEGIFEQVGFDITDAEDGIDISVNKGSNGMRTTYSAKAVLDGLSILQTPLSADELSLEPHDLKKICGKVTPSDKVADALHGDLRALLDINTDGASDIVEPDSPDDDDDDDDDDDGDELIADSKKKGNS